MILNINSNEVVNQTARLEKLHRSALPVAIRGALNDTVYDVKTKTMPEKAKVFKKRQPNFFKANSKFEKAEGFNVNTMKATVGFYENNLSNASNYAVKDLEQQEHGGTINKKSLIAQKQARQNNKNVKAEFRVGKLKGKHFIKTSSRGVDAKGNSITVNSLAQQFIRAAIYAESKFGKNAFVLGNRGRGGQRTLSLINQIRKGRHAIEVSRTPIYSVKKGRTVTVKATNFMKRASLESAAKMSNFYIKQAEKQFQKYQK